MFNLKDFNLKYFIFLDQNTSILNFPCNVAQSTFFDVSAITFSECET